MTAVMLPRHSREFMDSLSAEDFETASIRSAAPSYSSETPSTHYTLPNHAGGSLPPYAAPERSAAAPVSGSNGRRTGPTSAGPSSGSGSGSGYGLPAIPPNSSMTRRGEMPNLAQFRIPSWSSVSSNPNARLYHSVALRRVAAAEHASAAAEIGGLMRRLAMFEQEEAAAAARARRARAGSGSGNGSGNVSGSGSGSGTDGGNANTRNANRPVRPLEDPHLVGEAAANRARTARLAVEDPLSTDNALIHEDRRWDWFLGSFARPSTIPSPRRPPMSSSFGMVSATPSRRRARLRSTFMSL